MLFITQFLVSKISITLFRAILIKEIVSVELNNSDASLQNYKSHINSFSVPLSTLGDLYVLVFLDILLIVIVLTDL